MTARPKRTPEQQLGQLAEQLVGAFVTAQGDVWHPTALGNDLGLDGRVELLKRGEPTGVEFGVQVKAAQQLRPSRNGYVPAGRARASTVRYWLSRLSPTLVVAYSKAGGRLYAGWAHRIPAVQKVDDGPAQRPKTLSLRVPSEPLTDDRWQRLSADAESMHGVIVGAFNDDAVRQMFGHIHIELTAIADVLVEWVYAIAYPGGALIPTRPDAPTLNGPRFQREGGQMFPMWLASGAATLIESFRNVMLAHLDTQHPLSKLVVELAATLRALHDAIFVGGPPKSAPNGGGLTVGVCDVPHLVTNLGLIPLVIRDFNREIRPFLFPLQHALRSFAANPEEARNLKIIHSLGEHLFTPTAEWIEGTGVLKAPVRDDQ